MAGQAGAALHGEAGGLVEDEDLVVLVEDDRAEEIGILATGLVVP